MKKQPATPVADERLTKYADAGRQGMVRAFVLKFIRDPFLADDLVQDTLLRAHKSAAAFRGEASRKSWLYAIALNVVRDHFRATARLPRPVPDPEALMTVVEDKPLEDGLLRHEMDSCIRQYIFRLPERQRDVIVLHDVAGLTHHEVASVLDISENNSRILLHRGRAALRRLLEENCELSFGCDSVPCQPKPE